MILLATFPSDRGTIDPWDPVLLDALLDEREIIIADYPGVNLSSGITPGTVAGLADSMADSSTRSACRVSICWDGHWADMWCKICA